MKRLCLVSSIGLVISGIQGPCSTDVRNVDRFLQSNAAWAANKRGLQAVSAGSARRIKEKIESLTQYDVRGSTICTNSSLTKIPAI